MEANSQQPTALVNGQAIRMEVFVIVFVIVIVIVNVIVQPWLSCTHTLFINAK